MIPSFPGTRRVPRGDTPELLSSTNRFCSILADLSEVFYWSRQDQNDNRVANKLLLQELSHAYVYSTE